MKTKLLTLSLLTLGIFFSSTYSYSQSLTTEHEDAVYGVSSLTGLYVHMVQIDETSVAYVTTSPSAGRNLHIEIDIIDLSNNTSKHLNTTTKGNVASEPFYSNGVLIIPYRHVVGQSKDLMVVNIKDETFTPIHLIEHDIKLKKLFAFEEIHVLDDHVYFTARTIKEVQILGVFNLLTDVLKFKVYPKQVGTVNIFRLRKIMAICLSYQNGVGKSFSILGELYPDLSTSEDVTFLEGDQCFVKDIHISNATDGSRTVVGVTYSYPGIHSKGHPTIFWLNWNKAGFSKFGKMSVSDIKLNASNYSKEAKEELKIAVAKGHSYGVWNASFVQNDSFGTKWIMIQNPRYSFGVIEVNDEGGVNWSNVFSYEFPDIKPDLINVKKAHAFANIRYEDAMINVAYFEDRKIKSVDFSLDDGSISEKYFSDNLMLLKGENNKVIPLNFGMQVGTNEYILYQAFETGSKFTLDNSEYTRKLYVRHVYIE